VLARIRSKSLQSPAQNIGLDP
jgi:IS5 family transposase